jgi:sugar fermentation stimulation protein A
MLHRESNLLAGTILRRRQRFFADVRLDDGREITAHCANTGTMASCWESGDAVLLRPAANPARKLPWTWIACRRGRTWVGVDTSLANALVRSAWELGALPGVPAAAELRTEVAYGRERSRVDLWGRTRSGHQIFLEVKNTTLRDGELVRFPDARSERGEKHLRELAQVAAEGHRAVIVFLVQRADVTAFSAAGAIDPAYARSLDEAAAAGVQVIPLGTRLRAHTREGAATLEWQVRGVLPWRRG